MPSQDAILLVCALFDFQHHSPGYGGLGFFYLSFSYVSHEVLVVPFISRIRCVCWLMRTGILFAEIDKTDERQALCEEQTRRRKYHWIHTSCTLIWRICRVQVMLHTTSNGRQYTEGAMCCSGGHRSCSTGTAILTLRSQLSSEGVPAQWQDAHTAMWNVYLVAIIFSLWNNRHNIGDDWFLDTITCCRK